MTSTIQASTAVQATLPPTRTFQDDVAAPPSDPTIRPVEGADAGPAPSDQTKPAIGLSVARDTQGVFVYVLTDSADGRVLAIIPRGVVNQKGGGTLDVTA